MGRRLSASLPFAAFLLAACSTLPNNAPPVPLVDYHQHLVSPAFAPIVQMPPRDGSILLRELDTAGIRRAVVLSVGYSFADERKKMANPDALTRAENDWTSVQVAGSNGRLIGFCSANPLRPAALAEIERCLGLPGMRGIKQHWGNAGVTLRNPAHVRIMQAHFALAERKRVPVLVHMRARGGENYGAEDARILLGQVVNYAPTIEIIVAHLGASGPGYGEQHDEVMGTFAAAAERRDPRLRNLFFEVSSNVASDTTPQQAAWIARRIRQIGPRKFLYGSDLTAPGDGIRRGWELFRTKVPLTPAELRIIAANRARFTR